MREYNVARAFLDARVQTIYGGTTEIMKEIIGRSLGRVKPEREFSRYLNSIRIESRFGVRIGQISRVSWLSFRGFSTLRCQYRVRSGTFSPERGRTVHDAR